MTPGVAAAAVVGRPDPEAGELPVAHVVDALPVSAAGKVLERELSARERAGAATTS